MEPRQGEGPSGAGGGSTHALVCDLAGSLVVLRGRQRVHGYSGNRESLRVVRGGRGGGATVPVSGKMTTMAAMLHDSVETESG